MMERIFVGAVPDQVLGYVGLLKEPDPKETIHKGDIHVVGPPIFLRVVVLFEMAAVLALFLYFAITSLSAGVIQSEIVGKVKVTGGYACTVLSPLNAIKVFNSEVSEAAHYSTALLPRADCVKALMAATDNCSAARMEYNILSAYGYDTSKYMCYGFFKNGDALCQASYTDLNGDTHSAGIPYKPRPGIQNAFPNYQNYPAAPSGTFLRSFIDGSISDVVQDLTLDVSSSYLQVRRALPRPLSRPLSILILPLSTATCRCVPPAPISSPPPSRCAPASISHIRGPCFEN